MNWIPSTFIEIVQWYTFIIIALGETGRFPELAGLQPSLIESQQMKDPVDSIPEGDT